MPILTNSQLKNTNTLSAIHSTLFGPKSLSQAIWRFTEMYMGLDNLDDTNDTNEENTSDTVTKSDLDYLKKNNFEQYRTTRYAEAFSVLSEKAKQLGTPCTDEQILKAKNIFFVHNLIEEVCYKALADVVKELNIQQDKITNQQSVMILAGVKEAAHVELRKEGGYVKKGKEIITAAQFNGVVSNLITIIHDRDTRLTDARYASLTDLCVALDDHNNYIKNLLFKSWFICAPLSSDTHLSMIKDIVDFNQRMSAQLGFDFEQLLDNKKSYYDQHHAHIRNVTCPITGQKTAKKFVNLTEVRALFDEETIEKLLKSGRGATPLLECLQTECAFTQAEVMKLATVRRVPSPARFGAESIDTIEQPALLEQSISVDSFLGEYYPELLQPSALHARI